MMCVSISLIDQGIPQALEISKPLLPTLIFAPLSTPLQDATLKKKTLYQKNQIPKTFPPCPQQSQGAPPRTVHSPSHTFGPASALSQIQNGMPPMQLAQDGQPPQMGEVWEEREVSRRVRIHEGGSSTPWVRTLPKPQILELDSWTSGRGKARGI